MKGFIRVFFINCENKLAVLLILWRTEVVYRLYRTTHRATKYIPHLIGYIQPSSLQMKFWTFRKIINSYKVPSLKAHKLKHLAISYSRYREPTLHWLLVETSMNYSQLSFFFFFKLNFGYYTKFDHYSKQPTFTLVTEYI